MVLMLLIDWARGVRPNGVAGPDGRWHSLPATDASYWITMLAAGTLGTAAGDWVAEETRARLGFGSLVLVAVLLGDVVRLRPVRQDDETLVLADDRGGAHGWHNAWGSAGKPPRPGSRA